MLQNRDGTKTNMTDLHFDYDQLVQNSLKTVIRGVLAHVGEHGLPGDHHFYITFETGADGVDIPQSLKLRYPDDMTIVLQNHFWDLKTSDDHFEVRLSFNQKPELLSIPFDAVIAFVDPGAQFALQFQSELYPEEEGESHPELPFAENLSGVNIEAAASAASGMIDADDADDVDDANDADEEGLSRTFGSDDGANVVPLDAFRKKG